MGDERTFTSGPERPHQVPPTVEDVLRSVRGLKMGFPPFVGIELRVDPSLASNQHYVAVSQELFNELENRNEEIDISNSDNNDVPERGL